MDDEPTCPLDRTDVVDRYFLEHRAKLLDVAAFLDRVDRTAAPDGPEDGRLGAFRHAILVLQQREPGRARRILELLSDPTPDPIASAAGMKGAYGAYLGAPVGTSSGASGADAPAPGTGP